MNKNIIIKIFISVIIFSLIALIYTKYLSFSVVISGSMQDEININDVVVTIKQSDYNVNDVISYKSDSMLVTHRIINETKLGYITKGDANNTDDGEIMKEAVVGKVVLIIPKVGKLIYFLKTPIGTSILVSLLLIVYIFPIKKKEGENIEKD